jgi:hypothetical protein
MGTGAYAGKDGGVSVATMRSIRHSPASDIVAKAATRGGS